MRELTHPILLVVLSAVSLSAGCTAREESRYAAVQRLATVSGPEAAAAIEKAALDPDRRVRGFALQAIARARDPHRAEAVERLLKLGSWTPKEALVLSKARYLVSGKPETRKAALSRIVEVARGDTDRMMRLDAADMATTIAPGEEQVLELSREFVGKALQKKGDPRLTGRAIDHLLAQKDEWPRRNFMKLCLSPDAKLRDAAMIVAGLAPDDLARTRRRLVDLGLRKSHCKEMQSAMGRPGRGD